MIYREMISQDAETEIAAKVIGDLLCLLPPDKRAGALAIATAAEDAERKEREKHGRFPIRSLDELTESWKSSRAHRPII
jgi:hypothetical protein